MDGPHNGALNCFEDSSGFIEFAGHRLLHAPLAGRNYPNNLLGNRGSSAVLFLLGNNRASNHFDPCLILNKRSQKVRQSGDLCCPGGHVSPAIDPLLARISELPGFPLWRWPHWTKWRRKQPAMARRLALLLATSLRESFEEMRLNPAGVQFIGPLPVVRLVMFNREIFPMVGWVRRQTTFFPNWEVDKIVEIPIRDLLNSDHYRRYRLRIGSKRVPESDQPINDYPCFLHRKEKETELLWGATYRITAAFLQMVFDFTPPALETLPVIRGVLDENYINGRSQAPGR